jgi:uncharacterized membrane protein YphA (DoxX/SURF4 family)
MSLSRRIARPLLASIFVAGGVDAINNPGSKAKAAEAVTVPLTESVPALPRDTETLVRINGAVQVGAGLLLSVGRFRRLAALALIGSLVPTTYAGHRFWEEDDEMSRQAQRIHFLKNVGLVGGLLLAAVDTEGAPSLAWRARRGADAAGHAVHRGGHRGKSGVQRAAQLATLAAMTGSTQATGVAARSADRIGQIDLGMAQQQAARVAGAGADLAGSYLHEGAELAGHLLSAGAEHAGGLLSRVGERLPVG